MPKDRILQGIGFAGSVTRQVHKMLECAPKEAKRILNCFTGVGRYNSALAEEWRVIDSWDVQIIGHLVNEGIFKVTEIERRVHKPIGVKGFMYETRFLRGIDSASAGLIDGIVKYGSVGEKAALALSLPSQTVYGRFADWSGSAAGLWRKWLDTLNKLSRYTDMPGVINAYYGDFFEEFDFDQEYDMVLYDPPVIRGSSDIYSSNNSYIMLDRLLGGKGDIPRWTLPTFYYNLRRVMQIKAPVKIVKYTSGLNPPMETFKEILKEYGKIEREYMFEQRKRDEHMFLVSSD